MSNARNDDLYVYDRWTKDSFDKNGHQFDHEDHGDHPVSHHMLQHPATVRNPRRGRWRDPSHWENTGYQVNACPTGPLVSTAHDGNVFIYYGGYGWNGSGDAPVPMPPSELEGLAIGKALSKLKNEKVNLALAFLERKETAELFTGTIHRIAGLYKGFKQKNLRSFAKAAALGSKPGNYFRKYPEDYLEFMYGVNPLMQDIQGSCDALHQTEKKGDNPYVITVKGRSSI
jgi:hypothetical protein